MRREGETSRRRRAATRKKSLVARIYEFADENRGASGGPLRHPPPREERVRACVSFLSFRETETERNGHDPSTHREKRYREVINRAKNRASAQSLVGPRQNTFENTKKKKGFGLQKTKNVSRRFRFG